jgi:hypothetical protein
MVDGHAAGALAAATEVALRFGLPAGSPEVLHQRSNVLVRLGSVVARVPATTRLARADPASWLERDVRLSAFVARRGVCVVSPTTDPPPGPHFARGLPVTLWHFVPHDPDHRFRPAEVAESLAGLHAALREYPGELPGHDPLGEAYLLLDRLAGEPEVAAADGRLRAALDSLGARLPWTDVQPLHGDAHSGNLLATPAGVCWLDFEDSWSGPLGWDLAVLAGTSRLDGAAALAAYPGAPGVEELAPFTELRRIFVLLWRFVIARRFPDRRGEARTALAAYLDEN